MRSAHSTHSNIKLLTIAPIVVLLLGSAIYFRGFTQALPYHFYDPDETNIWVRVTYLQQTGDFKVPYPPLRIWDLWLEFTLLDAVTSGGPASGPAQYVMGRLSTLLYSILLLAMTFRTGRELHHPGAGLAAMLLLIAQPNIVELSKVFRVDMAANMLATGCLFLSVVAAKRRSPKILILAVITGLAAATAKYVVFPIMIIPGLVLILVLPRTARQRTMVVVPAVTVLAVGLLMILKPTGVIAEFLTSFHARQLYEKDYIFEFVSLDVLWSDTLHQLGPVNFGLVMVGLPITFLLSRKWQPSRAQWVLIGIIAIMMIGHFLGLGLFVRNRPRDRIIIVVGFALVWGVTLSILTARRSWLTLAVAFAMLSPWLIQAWQYGSSLRLPDTRAEMANWFIENAPQGTRVATERINLFTRQSGFPGPNIYHGDTVNSLFDRTLEDYQNSGIEYLVAHPSNDWRGGYYSNPDDTIFLSQYEKVFEIVPRGQYTGPSLIAFAVTPIQQNVVYLWFGDGISFRGFDLPRTELQPGFEITFTLYWMSAHTLDTDYIVITRLALPIAGEAIAEYQDSPGSKMPPTSTWNGNMEFWKATYQYVLPQDITTGTYDLQIRLADPADGSSLSITTPYGEELGDTFTLGQIIISASD